MIQNSHTVTTDGRGAIDITALVRSDVAQSKVDIGLCHVFLLHTSASLMLCENADPDVLADLEYFMKKNVTDGDRGFKHRTEGADDMAAHIRSVITHNDLTLPIRNGSLMLGTWQGVFLWEHRYRTHRRQLVTTIYP